MGEQGEFFGCEKFLCCCGAVLSMKLPPAIMILGTASNVGKSLLAAGLCRALAGRGLRVAPFKAQNMSLNSWVTAEGEEIGIAQAIQARACRLAPEAAMNPILLKPMGSQGSQILALGKPYGTMPYEEYIKHKPTLWQIVTMAYARLASGRDVMVLEGAGSPAEINLRSHDLVNLRMAHHARARAILTADIDKGGAFAALVGTMALLGKRDRSRVAAFLLNKFRGNAALLEPAMRAISRRCRRPFIGVMPYLENLRLPEEDSQSFCNNKRRHDPAPCGKLDIAILELPWLSNLADWDPLLLEPGVHVRMVARAEQLGRPHLLIIPGSRHVPKALEHLRKTELDKAICELASQLRQSGRGQIVGICAGLQVLGNRVADPHGLEGGGEHPALGLLDLTTVLEPGKILSRREAMAGPPLTRRPLPCYGQEIHHGQIRTEAKEIIVGKDGKALGWADASGQIWGAWLHGIWDADIFRHAWLNKLASQFGLGTVATLKHNPDAELDRLAAAIEKNLNLPQILAWLGA